jgi:hypothetical protein
LKKFTRNEAQVSFHFKRLKEKQMKINFKTISKRASCLLMISFLVMMAGCSDSNDSQSSEENKNISTLEPAQKKPQNPIVDMHSAVISNDIEAIKLHLLAGSDLNIKDPFGGSSPLISAALFGKKEIAKILIEAGVDINVKNNDGSTALHTAAFFCRPEIVQMLLDQGIDTTIKNNMGATAYDSVAGEFQEIKPIYDMLGQSLAPFGLELDYDYLQKTRPVIAEMLK